MKNVFASLVFAAISLVGATSYAQAPRDKVLFVLDWVVYGRHAPYFAALDKGFFAQHGIDVQIERGYGSAASLKQLGAGQADFILADFGGLVLARANEGLRAKMVAIGYSKNGHAVFYLDGSGIHTPKDLVGKRVAASPGTTVAALFPGFLKANGIDPSGVKLVNIDPQALNAVLLAKRVDAMLEFNFNEIELQKQGAKSNPPLVPHYFLYADHNFSFYANGIITRDETIEKRPDLVKRFTAAVIEGYKYSFAHPDEACTILRKRYPDIEQDVCLGELGLVKDLVLTDETKQHGIGYMSRERVQKTIDVLKEYIGFKGTVTPDELYTMQFLPKP